MNKFELVTQNESFVLGAVLNDPTIFDEIALTEQHFLDSQNKALFKAMKEVKEDGKEINIFTLSELGEGRSIQFGGTKYLGEIMASCPSANGFKNYESNILSFHTIQQAQEHVREFMNNTKDTYNLKELNALIQSVNKLEADTVRDELNFQQLLQKRLKEHAESPSKGLSGTDTGFTSMNKYTDGWQPSDLIIIGARPSMGKTALVLNSLLNASKKGVMTTFFSIEMAKEQIIDRLLAAEGKINLMKMRNPNKAFNEGEWSKHSNAAGVLARLSMDIRGEYTTQTIRSAIRRNVRENPNMKHVVAIDFLTLIKHTDPSGNMHSDITDIIWDLKQTAKDLKVPIIVLAQLNRNLEQRNDKRPNMADLRESGSIEQIADMITFLYRDDYYNPDTEQQGITEIIIGKNRNGSTGTVKMKFYKETNLFTDIT